MIVDGSCPCEMSFNYSMSEYDGIRKKIRKSNKTMKKSKRKSKKRRKSKRSRKPK